MFFKISEFRSKVVSCHVKHVNERLYFHSSGSQGWHIVGSFQPAPFAYSLYHMVSVPLKGDTVFAPLNEIVENLPSEKRNEWERLWMTSDR